MRGKKPSYGTERIIKKFTLFPIYCNNGDWAWLESVMVKQVFSYRIGVSYIQHDQWENLEFVNEKE